MNRQSGLLCPDPKCLFLPGLVALKYVAVEAGYRVAHLSFFPRVGSLGIRGREFHRDREEFGAHLHRSHRQISHRRKDFSHRQSQPHPDYGRTRLSFDDRIVIPYSGVCRCG